MKHPFLLSSRRALVGAAAVVSGLIAACSSTTVAGPAGPPPCDPTQCAPRNQCINNGADTKCRLPCAAHVDCPANYQCASVPPAIPSGATVDPALLGAFCSNIGFEDGKIFAFAGVKDCQTGTCLADGRRKVILGGAERIDTYCSASCETAGCPSGWECLENTVKSDVDPKRVCAKQSGGYCVKNTTEVPQKAVGQWGTSCLPTGGQDANPACDLDNAFICYGTGPTDANAYCTRAECTADLDCAGGYWCATVNDKPNVKSAERSFGKTHTVCLKHTYCSPCAADRDCPVIDGKQSRCADDDVGGKYCASVCTTSTECRLDATCTNVVEDGTKVCKPRAGVCKGDGSICSPCGSDADCPNGFCIKAGYSPEKFCSVKAASACPAPSGGASITKGDCPAFTARKTTSIGCQALDGNDEIPRNQCIGLIEFGDSGDIACYTLHP
ncbi:hypothetical protein BH11MYX4_BH11MYX4_31770 [soil metagenome]